jgi:hypothetical protein
MTGKRARSRRDPDDDSGGVDRRMKPGHAFHDIGAPIYEEVFRPRVFGDPEAAMARIFAQLGRDYRS